MGVFSLRVTQVCPFTSPLRSTSYAGSTTYYPRGVASADGVTIYDGDGLSLNVGQFGAAATTGIGNFYYYGMQVGVFGGNNALMYLGCNSATIPCATSNIYVSNPAMPVSGSTMNVAVSGLTLPQGGSFVIVNSSLIYAGGDVLTANGGLRKFVQALTAVTTAGPWTSPLWPSTGALVKNPNATTMGVKSITGRFESGVYVIYHTTSGILSNMLWRYSTAFDSSATVGAGYTLLSSAPSGNTYLAVMVMPIPIPTPTSTRSSTPTATSTPSTSATLSLGASPTTTSTAVPTTTATQTPSVTPIVNLFQNSSVLVVRVGDYTTQTLGRGLTMPVYVDEIDPTGTQVVLSGTATVRTITMPTTCTLANGGLSAAPGTINFDTVGFPSLATDGSLVSFACYRLYGTPGSTVVDSTANTHTIVTISAAGIVGTTTSLYWGVGGAAAMPAGLHTAVWSAATSRFYLAGSPGWGYSGTAYGGVAVTALGATSYGTLVASSATGSVGYLDMRCVAIFGTTLYATDSSADGLQLISSFGATLPTGATASTALPGMTNAAYSPWSMIFENANSLWTSDVSNLALFNVVQYVLSAGTWSVGQKLQLAPNQFVYSIAGRYEAVGAAPATWIVYGTTPSTLFRYDTGAGALTTVTTADAGFFRGVVLPPLAKAYLQPSPFNSKSPTHTGTPSPSSSPSQTASTSATLSIGASPSTSATPTVTATASATSTASASSTATVSISVSATPTPTQTGTPTNPLLSFEPTSVVVVRVGDPVYPASTTPTGVTMPVYIDEYDTTGQSPTYATQMPMSSWAGPLSTCTMAQGHNSVTPPYMWWSAEGLPQISTDGAWITFSCYRNLPPGSTIIDASTTLRTLARVSSIGAYDTSTFTYEGYGGTGSSPAGIFGVVYAATNNNIYFFFGPGYAVSTNFYYGGLHTMQPGASKTSGYSNVILPYWVIDPGCLGARALGIFNGQLYGSDGVDNTWKAVFAIGSGLPTAQVTAAENSVTGNRLVPGFTGAGVSPWQFVFENTTSLWVADDSSPAAYNILHWMKPVTITNFSMVSTVSLAPAVIMSVAGRNESGVGFVLYATSTSKLFRYVTTTGVSTVLGVATSDRIFRGVAVAPVSNLWRAETPLPTATSTQTSTMTSTPSNTPSASNTASLSSSASPSLTPSSSLSSGASTSATPAATGTPAVTSSTTPSTSTTPSSSTTPTTTASSTGTPTGTASNSATKTGTRTPTTTGTPTPSATGTPPITKSSTVTPTTTSTQTQTPTNSGTQTKTPTTTGTATPSPSTTASQSGTPSASNSFGITGTSSPSQTASSSSTATTTATSSATLTATPTTSATRSATYTPTPTRLANHFYFGNALVVRFGDATYDATRAAVGTALPVYLDEYDPTKTLRKPASSLALSNTLCTLAKGHNTIVAPFMWFDTEGACSCVESLVAVLRRRRWYNRNAKPSSVTCRLADFRYAMFAHPVPHELRFHKSSLRSTLHANVM